MTLVILFALALLAAPIFGIVLKRSNWKYEKKLSLLFLATLVSTVLAFQFGLSFRGYILDWVLIFLLYSLLGILSFVPFKRGHLLRNITGCITSAPFLFFGITLPLIWFGFAMIAVAAFLPTHESYGASNHVCRVYSAYGGIGSMKPPNHDVAIYQQFLVFERQLESETHIEDRIMPNRHCESALKRYSE